MAEALIIFNHSSHDIIYNRNYNRFNVIKTIRNVKKTIPVGDSLILNMKTRGSLLLRMEHMMMILGYKKIPAKSRTVELHIYDTIDTDLLIIGDKPYAYEYSGNDRVYAQSDDIGNIIVEDAAGYTIQHINSLGFYGAPRKNIIPRSIRHALAYIVISAGLGLAAGAGYLMTH